MRCKTKCIQQHDDAIVTEHTSIRKIRHSFTIMQREWPYQVLYLTHTRMTKSSTLPDTQKWPYQVFYLTHTWQQPHSSSVVTLQDPFVGHKDWSHSPQRDWHLTNSPIRVIVNTMVPNCWLEINMAERKYLVKRKIYYRWRKGSFV